MDSPTAPPSDEVLPDGRRLPGCRRGSDGISTATGPRPWTPRQFHAASEPHPRRAINTVIDGKAEAAKLALTVLLAQGHLLLEDVPGVGKTMLAKTLARTIDCTVSRIQFTPDLLPSDVTGVSIYNQAPAPVRVPARRGVRQHRDRRRDQPRLRQDPVRPAGMHGGAPGHGGRHILQAGRAVHGGGDAEPHRDGRHLPAAGGPAGPFHGPDLHGLPGPGVRDGDAGDPPGHRRRWPGSRRWSPRRKWRP